jgi:uncharacterized repeat protein (TIGR01451 family)
MFKKLVSNLPFNPGLMDQVAFYGKRLHKEQAIRKLSFGFMAATLVINILALAAPAQNTLATSPNDIIYGAKSKDSVLTALNNDKDGLGRTDIQDIYNYYGITAADIQAATPTSVRSTSANYTTTGRWLSPGDDDPQTIPGAETTVYERSLRVWDIQNPYNDYPSITGVASGNGKLKGQRFWILLKGCGNIAYIPQPKTPKVEIKKTRLSADKLRPGESVSYRIDYRNSGNAASTGTLIGDTLNAGLSYVSAVPAPSKVEGNHLEWSIGNLEPSSEWHQITITASVKNITTATAEICNIAGIYTSNAGGAPSENPCFIVENRCPGTDLPAPGGDVTKCEITCPGGQKVPFNEPDKCPIPVITCVDLLLVGSPEWDERTVRLTTKRSAGSEISKVSFLVDGKTSGSKDKPGDKEEFTYTKLSEGKHTYTVKYDVKKGELQASKSCEIKDEVTKPVPGISAVKKVKNQTKNVDNADNTTVSAGDVIEYTLVTTNSGTGAAKGYVIKPDSLGPVLEYADLKEVGEATFDKTSQQLSWAPVDIKPGESVTKVFTVQVKNPIPVTAPSQSDPAGRQFKICNKYGNNTCVNVEKPLPAVIRTTATQLPNTGPGTSIVLTFITVLVVGFFYGRSRVLAKEIDIVRHEYGMGAQ